MSGAADNRLDATVERLGRWTAARTTRRSFLHRMGQLAVVVAAGPSIGGLLMRAAEARVCGQSGVTPKCATFDCTGPGDVWGWCWYASDGCCRNGGLKKICDCCTVNYPNVHGYCPSGTNVRCIVESCGTDPRVQTVALTPLVWTGAAAYHHAAIGAGQALATRAVVAPDQHRWLQYVAAPLAGALGGPLLGIAASGPTADDLAILGRLGVRQVLVVGPVAATSAFTDRGLGVDVVTTGADPAAVSRVMAERIRTINDSNRTVTVEPVGLSAEAAPVAAIFAALGGFPLLVGSGVAAELGAPTLAVGPEPSPALAGERTSATGVVELSMELANLAAVLPNVPARRLALAPAGTSDVIGLANLGIPVVLHPAGNLGPLEWWLQAHALSHGDLTQVYHVQGPGQLPTPEYWKLQAAVNNFRVDQLQGVAGQGLPVIRQPMAERPVGRARIDGALDLGSRGVPSYWTSQGQTFRR